MNDLPIEPVSENDAPPPSRSERRNAEVRAQLEPLAPGQRPTAVTVAAIVALVMAIANLAAWAAGARPVGGGDNATFQLFMIVTVLVVAAAGMWKARYWAVMGFQTFLALQILVSSLVVVAATEVWEALIALAVIAASGTLFWFLIRAMARLQMPVRATAGRSGDQPEQSESKDTQ